MVLWKSFYIHWSAGRPPRVHEVNPGRDPSQVGIDTPSSEKPGIWFKLETVGESP